MSSTGGISGTEGKGVVEIVARTVVIVFAFSALVAAAVAVGTLNAVVGSASCIDICADTRGASGWIIFVALAAIAIMVVFIILRIAGRRNTIIMAVGIVLSIVLGLGYFAGGVAAAVFASEWSSSFNGDSFTTPGGRIMISLAAAAAWCLFSDVALVVLIIINILKK